MKGDKKMKCDSIFRIWVYKDKIMLPCSSIYFLQGGTQVEDACTFEGWCQVDDDYKDEIEVDCDLMQYIDAVVSIIIYVNLILYKYFNNIVA